MTRLAPPVKLVDPIGMDVIFMALVEAAIEAIDDRFGRAVAWAMAIALLVLPIASVVALLWWLS